MYQNSVLHKEPYTDWLPTGEDESIMKSSTSYRGARRNAWRSYGVTDLPWGRKRIADKANWTSVETTHQLKYPELVRKVSLKGEIHFQEGNIMDVQRLQTEAPT